MSETETSTGTNGSGAAKAVRWARRSEVPPFSPAPGIQIQPVIGESLMTCWIAMEPGAVVAEHSHPNEQLGVVVEGSVSFTAEGETWEMVAGDAYVVPRDVVHGGLPERMGPSSSTRSFPSARSTPRRGERWSRASNASRSRSGTEASGV